MSFAFVFGEATVRAKPSGANEEVLGYVQTYTLDRDEVLTEDGRAARYNDKLSLESPWVDDNVETFFKTRGPFDYIVISWTNADDSRLRSASLTKAVCRSVSRKPTSQFGPETFAFQFEAVSLA